VEELDQLQVGRVATEVVLDDAVDAALDEDVVVASNQAHLRQTWKWGQGYVHWRLKCSSHG